MHTRTKLIVTCIVTTLSGCGSVATPPLFFGELVTFGLDVGATPGSAGADFTLGYRDRNLAVIPVSAVNNGRANEIVAWNQEDGGNRRDALSVFGQFKSQATKSSESGMSTGARKVTLGRFFATGLAATNLARGYRAGLAGTSKTPRQSSTNAKSELGIQPTTDAPNSDAVTTTNRSNSSGKENFASTNTPVSPVTASENHAYAPPLVFGQSNTIGIGVATSIADQGVSFTLGYAGRDIAFVPVMGRHADGSVTRLGGREQIGADGKPLKSPADSRESDAFSVFGQFETDTETGTLHYGLNRFFTTGIAARTLTEGYSAAIARGLQGNAKDTAEAETGAQGQ